MGKSKAPAAPDYTNLAVQQGQINKDTALYNSALARPNQTNPYGSISFTNGTDEHGNPTVNQSTTLAPAQQALFDNQQWMKSQLSQGKADTGIGAADNYIKQVAGGGLDFSSAPKLSTGEDARKAMVDAVYNQYAAKLDPRYELEGRQQENKLVQQGLTPGSDAYVRQMANFRRSRDDAYQSAANQSVIQGDASQNQAYNQSFGARDQAIKELMSKYGTVQSDYANYMNNTTPNLPTYQQAAGGGGAASSDMMGAAQNTYNANLNATNVNNSNKSSILSSIGSIAKFFI